MKKIKLSKLNKERGSATIEAIISFTGFLFVIFTILNVVNVCRAQMLISNAVDTATKELTQYSYFYKMSGLQKFKSETDGQADIGANNLNEVIGTVSDFYSTVGTSADNSVEHLTNAYNAAAEGSADITTLQNTIAGIDDDVSKISGSIDSMEAAFTSVADNPLMYMKSIVAVAGSEFLDTAVSHVIAAPLAKSFTVKHFGKTTKEADAELEKLGVVDGLDGMNFKMSTMFSHQEPDEVHIVVYYKLKIVQIFEWANLEVPMCKESIGRAWLGGDDVQFEVTPIEPPAAEETPAGDGAETPEGDGTETPEEEKTEEETKEETPEKVDTTNSYWHLGVDGHGYDNTAGSFDDLLVTSNGIDREPMVVNGLIYGRDKHNVAYGMDYCVDADDVHSNLIYYQSIRSLKAMEDAYVESNGTEGYEPGSTSVYKYVIYVPENISDEKLNEIKKASEENGREYSIMAEEEFGMDISVMVEIKKAGGNYDYGAESAGK